MSPRIPVADQLFRARVEILLANSNTLAERGRLGVVQDARSGSRPYRRLEAV